jgi:hypothetical protein
MLSRGSTVVEGNRRRSAPTFFRRRRMNGEMGTIRRYRRCHLCEWGTQGLYIKVQGKPSMIWITSSRR